MINKLFRILGLVLMLLNAVSIVCNINMKEVHSLAILFWLNIFWIFFCIEREIDEVDND